MEVSDWIAFGSLVVSVIAVIQSFLAGKKTKALDLRLKEMELEETQQQKEDRKKANIEVNVVETPRGKANVLRFYNKGQAIAKEVNFDIPSDEGVDHIQLIMRKDYLPYPQLLPQQCFDVPYRDFGDKPHQTIMITWNDEFSEGRTNTIVVDLL